MTLRRMALIVSLLATTLAASGQTTSAQPQAASSPSSDAAAKWTKPVGAQKVPDGGVPEYLRAETPEQRMARIGTAEDPGIDPDPEAIFWRFGKKYKLEKFDRKMARYDVPEQGWIRPYAPVNIAKELYQQNEKYVWVWIEQREPEVIKPEDDTTKYRKFSDKDIKFFEDIRGEFTPLTPPSSDVKIRFEEASKGLPTTGSWRNGLTVADVNEDGLPDLVLPPQRGFPGAPAIYLGDGKGNWKEWAIDFPDNLNYGTVAVADFNHDGHQDLAFAVHLTGVAVYLGNGKGKFTATSNEGLPIDDFPTRRLMTVDLDRDGWMDLVVISEGPVPRGNDGKKSPGGNLRGYFNREKGTKWELADMAPVGRYVGADWISSGNFNADKYPDFVGSSVYFNGVDMMYVSNGPKQWDVVGSGTLIPFLSYYYASTAGRFSSKTQDDAVLSYIRQWPSDLAPQIVPTPPITLTVGLDRYSFTGKEPKRTPIARWASNRGIWGMGRGDFDGDGKQDIVYTIFDPREAVVLLGDGAGNFKRAAVEGVKLANTVNYDLVVADVNRDGRPDLVVMYESDEKTALDTKNGSVQVFLNRGAGKADGATAGGH